MGSGGFSVPAPSPENGRGGSPRSFAFKSGLDLCRRGLFLLVFRMPKLNVSGMLTQFLSNIPISWASSGVIQGKRFKVVLHAFYSESLDSGVQHIIFIGLT